MKQELFVIDTNFGQNKTIYFVVGTHRKTFEQMQEEGWRVDIIHRFDEGSHFYGNVLKSGTHFAICHKEEN